MRSLRSFFCSLLCVCILCGLFSVSAYAQDVEFSVDGENQEITQVQDGVSTFALVTGHTYSLSCTHPLENSTVTGTIVSDYASEDVYLVLNIALAEEIEKNTYFDLRIQYTSDSFDNLSSTLYAYNSDWQNSCGSAVSFTGEHIASKNYIDFLEVGGTKRGVKYLEIYIFLEGVEWIEVDPTISGGDSGGDSGDTGGDSGSTSVKTFTINTTQFQYDEGMTVAQWVESTYNTEGFYISSSGYFSYTNDDDSGAQVLHKDSSGSWSSTYKTHVINSSYVYSVGGLNTLELYQYEFDFSISSITINTLDEEKVSGGILGWVKSIFNGIINLPSNIANKISGFFTELGNKVSALGDAIIDGIKGLFIPSEESMTDLKNKFEGLLADRFGAVYESTAVIDNFANAFFNQAQVSVMSENSGIIQFPSVSVKLAGVDFDFGGWDVDIIPDGFQDLVDVLKLIIDISCTFVFINALRKKLEALLA